MNICYDLIMTNNQTLKKSKKNSRKVNYHLSRFPRHFSRGRGRGYEIVFELTCCFFFFHLFSIRSTFLFLFLFSLLFFFLFVLFSLLSSLRLSSPKEPLRKRGHGFVFVLFVLLVFSRRGTKLPIDKVVNFCRVKTVRVDCRKLD